MESMKSMEDWAQDIGATHQDSSSGDSFMFASFCPYPPALLPHFRHRLGKLKLS